MRSFGKIFPCLAAVFCLAFAASAGEKTSAFSGTGVISNAEWTPFQFNLFPGAQLFDSKTNVYGLNLGALISCQDRDVGFFSWAPLNLAKSNKGLDIKLAGWGDNNYGMQMALFSCAEEENAGLMMDLVSMAKTNKGVMCSVVNLPVFSSPKSKSRAQIGVYNQANSGLQIGFLNYNPNAAIPFLPLANYSAPDIEAKAVKPPPVQPARPRRPPPKQYRRRENR